MIVGEAGAGLIWCPCENGLLYTAPNLPIVGLQNSDIQEELVETLPPAAVIELTEIKKIARELKRANGPYRWKLAAARKQHIQDTAGMVQHLKVMGKQSFSALWASAEAKARRKAMLRMSKAIKDYSKKYGLSDHQLRQVRRICGVMGRTHLCLYRMGRRARSMFRYRI
jgi:hypothetical protein